VNDQSKSAEPNDPQVVAALREYLERVDRGEPVDWEEFLARHARVAAQLRSVIVAEDEVRKLDSETPLDRTRASSKSFVGHSQETVPPQSAAKWKAGRWILLSVLAFGLAVFGVMSGMMVIYLGRTALVIDVHDPGVEVAVNGTTLTITGPKEEKVYVEPGEQQLTITCAGLDTITKSFTIKKGQTKVVTVSIFKPENRGTARIEVAPSIPTREQKTSSPTRIISIP
jgi:hypothetical protein